MDSKQIFRWVKAFKNGNALLKMTLALVGLKLLLPRKHHCSGGCGKSGFSIFGRRYSSGNYWCIGRQRANNFKAAFAGERDFCQVGTPFRK